MSEASGLWARGVDAINAIDRTTGRCDAARNEGRDCAASPGEVLVAGIPSVQRLARRGSSIIASPLITSGHRHWTGEGNETLALAFGALKRSRSAAVEDVSCTSGNLRTFDEFEKRRMSKIRQGETAV